MPQKAFPFDRGMPDLAQAIDCEAMRQLLGRHIWTGELGQASIRDCRIVRIRYRPETRCLVQYEVTLRDGHSGSLSTQLVTGTMFAHPRKAARHAARLEGAAFIPELRMLVSMFPLDIKLPHAGVLMSADDAELRAAVLHSFGDASWSIDAWTTEAVRYRGHLSLVVRYTVAARQTTGELGRSEKVFYAKAYPERDAARGMFDYLRALADYARTSHLGIRIDSPLACIDRLGTVVLAAGQGRPLSDIVADAPAAAAVVAVRESARAVARFNLSDAPTVRSYSAADYLASLDRPMTHLRCACPALDRDLRQIRGHAASTLRDVPGHPTHRDMKPEHVLLGPGGPGLIDLDSCASADPLLDPALMLARFAGLHSSDGADTRMNALAHAFAGEYFACVPDSWRGRLPLYYATSLVEVAAGLFHRQESEWRRRATSLVRAAAEIVAGKTPRWLRHCS